MSWSPVLGALAVAIVAVGTTEAQEAAQPACTAPVAPQVRYALRPEKPGGSVSHGGLVRIDVREAGTYRVALDSAAWIDLVRDRQALRSTAHGHGPHCTGVRKMVDYSLTPGPYILQISANGQPQMTVLLARLP